MPAGLFKEMATYARKPAWHGLGTVFEEPITAEEAVVSTGADFGFTLAPIYASVESLFGAVRVPVDGKRAIIRDEVAGDPMKVVGIAGENYEVITNLDFARAIDKLTPMWPVETFGVLKDGATVFFTLKVGSKNIGSSNLDRYFLVTDTRDGGTSAKFMYTNIRVECQNMLAAALSSDVTKASLQHRSGAGREFEFRMDLLKKLQETSKKVDEAFEAMALATLNDEQRDIVFSAAFPVPNKPVKTMLATEIEEDDEGLRELREMGLRASKQFEYYINRAANSKSDLITLHTKFNDEYPDHANTAWSAYNVVCEYADFREGQGDMFYSAVFGTRAAEKRRAFEAAVDFAY